MSCGVGCGQGSDLVLLWLWCRPAAAAPISPLAWEPYYAVGVALKRPKKKNKNKNKKTKPQLLLPSHPAEGTPGLALALQRLRNRTGGTAAT